jgi:hypothetical protein
VSNGASFPSTSNKLEFGARFRPDLGVLPLSPDRHGGGRERDEDSISVEAVARVILERRVSLVPLKLESMAKFISRD